MEEGTLHLPPVSEARAHKARVPAVILYDGDEIGGLHSLTKDETVIGRTAGCDIVIPEARVSRRHAVIRRTRPGGDEFEVVDLGSTNGTWIESEQVDRVSLSNQMEFRIGSHVLMFIITGE